MATTISAKPVNTGGTTSRTVSNRIIMNMMVYETTTGVR